MRRTLPRTRDTPRDLPTARFAVPLSLPESPGAWADVFPADGRRGGSRLLR